MASIEKGQRGSLTSTTSTLQFPPGFANWMEEMEKRFRRRIRDLVALPAFQGLSQNEIGCAWISMMARSTNAQFKGRIRKRKTNYLQIITFGLQRTAGPYRMNIARDSDCAQVQENISFRLGQSIWHGRHCVAAAGQAVLGAQ